MVPPVQVAYDVAGIISLYALVPLLWVVLFLLVFEEGPFARSIGFGARTLWLLVLGVVLSFFAELPIARFDGDNLAINIGGGLIPVLLSCLLFAQFAPPRGRTLPAFLLLFVVECGAALSIVLAFPAAPVAQAVGIAGVATVATVAATALPSRWGFDRPVAALVGLTSGVLVVTFLITSAQPGVGITALFPADLVAPVSVGVLASLLAPMLYDEADAARSIPLAYAAGTFGVIMGADLLRQPGLYGSGPTGLYVIGGANLLDLVYLSGLLAFAMAYLAYRSTGLPRTPLGSLGTEEAPRPTRLLAEAVRLRFDGDPRASIRRSSEAARAAAEQSRRLWGASPRDGGGAGRPWDGLRVPGWVVADQANLDALAGEGSTRVEEAERSAQMARRLVGLGRFLSAPRFASARARSAAFLVDLVIILAPALALGTWLLRGIPSGSDPLQNLSFVTLGYGLIAAGFLYFVLFDVVVGTTPGKYLFRLIVRERSTVRSGFVPSMVREAPKLLDLTAIGIFGPVLLAVIDGRSVDLAGVSLSGAVAGVALLFLLAIVFVLTGTASVVGIMNSSDHQRVGDRLGDTVVLRRSVPSLAPPPTATPEAGAPPSGASGS